MILLDNEPLLFNQGDLPQGLRDATPQNFLKLHPKCGYSTPTVAGLEQGHISPPSFSFAPVVQGEIRLECHTKEWPLASGRMLTAVCTDSRVTSHLWGWLGPGWREEGADQVSQLWSVEWARMKKLLIKASWAKGSNGNSAGRAQAPVARWGRGHPAPWMGAFVPAPFDNRKHLKQLEPAIYKSDWPNAMTFKIDIYQNHVGKFLEIQVPGLFPQRL